MIVATKDLDDATAALDVILEGMRYARQAGIEVTVDDLVAVAVNDLATPEGSARVLLILAIALQRLI